MIRISNLNMRSTTGYNIIEAEINDFTLYFKVPIEYPLQISGDPFLVASFFPAMLTGNTVVIDKQITISKKLVAGIGQLQKIFQSWYPYLKQFEIKADTSFMTQKNAGVGSFFSGGVDGLYTLSKNKSEITHLIHINGFDFEMNDDDFQNRIKLIKTKAELFEKKIIPVETNFYSFMKKDNISRPLNHGSCLASIGLLLGFPLILIPASYTYNDLHPWGSHPVTDHLWSSDYTEFRQDGAEAKRTMKIESLSLENKSFMDEVIVCWELLNSNCGNCPKCIRTMVSLKSMDVKSKAFPYELSLKDIQKLWIGGHGELTCCYENIELAKKNGKNQIVVALKKAILRYRLREVKNRIMQLFRY